MFSELTKTQNPEKDKIFPVVIEVDVTNLCSLHFISNMKVSSGTRDRGGDGKPCDSPHHIAVWQKSKN